MQDLAGILAGSLTIVGAFLIPSLAMYFKHKGRKLRQAERLTYIEKGLPIPAALEEKKKSIEETKRYLFIGGLITLFAGIGIFGFFYFSADLKTASQFGIVFIATGIGLLLSSVLIKEKIEAQGGGVANKIVQQYFNLTEVKNPSIISPYYAFQATKNFEDAPIRIVEFADLQCPDCLKLRNDLEYLRKDFGDEMNVVFQFFPLDGKCNTVVEKDLHPQSCALSYIAAHDPSKFRVIHDEIFDNFHKTRSDAWVRSLAKKYGVEGALTDERTRSIVHDIINTGKEYKPTSERFKYGIRSIPTMILNERMIIGILPRAQLRAIFKAILDKQKKAKEEAPEFIEYWR